MWKNDHSKNYSSPQTHVFPAVDYFFFLLSLWSVLKFPSLFLFISHSHTKSSVWLVKLSGLSLISHTLTHTKTSDTRTLIGVNHWEREGLTHREKERPLITSLTHQNTHKENRHLHTQKCKKDKPDSGILKVQQNKIVSKVIVWNWFNVTSKWTLS